MFNQVKRVNNLIKRISKGDIKALDKLFEEFGNYFNVIARRYLVDKSYSEDIVSMVMLKLVKYSNTFNEEKNGLNWIFKMIKNEALNFNKKQGKLVQLVEYDSLEIVFEEEKLINGIDISKAIKKLDSVEKSIINYVYWEGLTIREIAKKMNKPLSTTHSLLKRALKKLSKSLNDETK